VFVSGRREDRCGFDWNRFPLKLIPRSQRSGIANGRNIIESAEIRGCSVQDTLKQATPPLHYFSSPVTAD
jgi:hypothetical protein